MLHPHFLLGLSLLSAAIAQPAPPLNAVVIQNDLFRLAIAPDGRNLEFLDRASGTNYLATAAPSSCAEVRVEGKDVPATAAALAGDRLTLRFGASGIEAVLRVEPHPACVCLTVESATGSFDALTFLNVPLTLGARPSEPFGACALSLNLVTRVDALPALQTGLRAAAYPKFGVAGAKIALVGAPMPRMLDVLKATIADHSQLPVCKVAGPWARDIPFNHGSYLFNFGTLTETNLEDWVAMTRSLGFNQIDNHGGSAGFFRFGDFALNRDKWPDGWEAWRRIVDRLHTNGIGSIFHTYAFFIDKQSKYVTPVPDPRLDAFRTFTLAEPIGTNTETLVVRESTAGLTTTTGFFVHNSTVLQLGDELVTFSGVRQQPPWGFTGLKRGALGTRAAPHAASDRARHLKECFGLFVPDPESTLFEEIAANHADVVNRCGFDGVYLDAIDGSSILRGPDECWYWADRFVVEIQKRLRKPVGMEMSAMWHHFWQYRTRWQAWDFPQRGHQRFLDLHADAVNGGLLLPLHLGWWDFQSFKPPQIDPTYPEVIEQLGARLIGWDAGISLTGAVDRNRLETVPLFRRAVDILRTCENLRHAGAFPDALKAQLREPGSQFALVTNVAGQPRFRRSHSVPHLAAVAEPWTLTWQVTNPFPAQPLRLRIEALAAGDPAVAPGPNPFADFVATNAAGWAATAAQGVEFTLTPDSAGPVLTATNAGRVPRHAAWVRFQKKLDPVLDLAKRPALGLEVEGDGLGELLAIRIESPEPIAYGAIADRYLTIDFTGRRRVTLVETESSRWNDYAWNDGKSLYNVHRETVDFARIESVSVWLQNLPPGRTVRCQIRELRPLAFRDTPLESPVLTLNGATLSFPVTVPPGGWIELIGPDDCRLYGPKGEPLGNAQPRGTAPEVRSGANDLTFACTPAPGSAPRVRITLFSLEETL
jgi:hypothetical protein